VDRVIIKDLLVRGIIGVNDWERQKPQDILINIVAFTDTRQAASADDLGESVNYRTLAHTVREHAESAARYTVEALANDLASLCLQDPAIARVLVRVEKPRAVRFAASVGVEIERSRDGEVP
jgi:FolB domain-containing protein